VRCVRVILDRRIPGRCDERDVVRVIDTVWAHAVQNDGLEHVSGRSADGRIEILLFLREDTARTSERQAAGLIHRVYRNSVVIQTSFEFPSGCDDLHRLLVGLDRGQGAFDWDSPE